MSEDLPTGTADSPGAAALNAVWPVLLEMVGPVYVATPDGRIVFANRAFDETIRAVFLSTHDRIPDALARRIAQAPRALRQNERVETDGATRVFEGRHRRVPEQGAPSHLIGVFEEITRAREALESVRALRGRLDEFLSTVSDWVWELDASWRFRQSSTRTDEVLGFDPSELLGADFFDAGEQVENPKARERRPLRRNRRAPFEQVLYRIEDKQGCERLFELSAIPVFNEEDGAFTGFQGSARDVTREAAADRRARDYRDELEQALSRLKQKNAELDDALTRAQAAGKAKNQFLAMVGHELRTPLNAVIGFSEMMDQQVFGPLGSPQYEGYVGDILASSQHLLGVINDIIDVVKLELDEVTLRLDEVGVTRTVETALSFVRERALKADVRLTTRLGGAPAHIVADPQKLRQMLVNLLSNAVKFTDAGGEIIVEANPRGEAALALSVIDTGIGISPDDLETIVQPFKQADTSLARNYDGLGLGLPLTKALVEAHGGSLQMDSEPHAGTRMTLLLPVDGPAVSD